MAQTEEARGKSRGKKGLLSAVYVNRFGKHLSGTVIRFGDKGTTEEKNRPMSRQQASACLPEESTCPPTTDGAEPGLGKGLKSRRDMKRSTFTPPAHLNPELSLEQTEPGTLMQNNENADVFKFPLPANSDAAKGKSRKKKGVFGKQRETFRVICKMLHENENLRTRLMANSKKKIVADEQTISEREKGSPKTLDATPFGWV